MDLWGEVEVREGREDCNLPLNSLLFNFLKMNMYTFLTYKGFCFFTLSLESRCTYGGAAELWEPSGKTKSWRGEASFTFYFTPRGVQIRGMSEQRTFSQWITMIIRSKNFSSTKGVEICSSFGLFPCLDENVCAHRLFLFRMCSTVCGVSWEPGTQNSAALSSLRANKMLCCKAWWN